LFWRMKDWQVSISLDQNTPQDRVGRGHAKNYHYQTIRHHLPVVV
jgi:hypothetical protein